MAMVMKTNLPMAGSCDLSAIIVNWNTKRLLRNCLSSVYAQGHGITYEVLVVDNGSSDGSTEMVETEFPQTRLLRNIENVGFAKANNQAIELSKGRYVLLLNSDTVVLDGALQTLVRFMDQYADAGAAGCKLVNEQGALEYSCRSFPRPKVAFFLNHPWASVPFGDRWFQDYLLLDWEHNTVRPVDFVTGACLIVRRECIQEVGLLDEAFFMMVEDVDWCYRIRKGGWEIYYVPSAEVIHIKGASYANDANGRRMRLEAHRSMIRFFKKHYQMGTVIHFRAFAVAASLLGILKILVKCAARRRWEERMGQEVVHHWTVARLCLGRQI